MSESLDLVEPVDDMVFGLYAAIGQAASERFGVSPKKLKPFAQEYFQNEPLDAKGKNPNSALIEQTKIYLDLNHVTDAPGDTPAPVFSLRFEHGLPTAIETIEPQILPKAVAAYILGYSEEFEEIYATACKKYSGEGTIPELQDLNPFEFGYNHPELARLVCTELCDKFADPTPASLLHEVVSQEYTVMLDREERPMLIHTEDRLFRAQEEAVGIFTVAHVNGYLDRILTFQTSPNNPPSDPPIDRRTARLTRKALRAIVREEFDEDEAADLIIRRDVQTAYRLLRLWLQPQKYLSSTDN